MSGLVTVDALSEEGTTDFHSQRPPRSQQIHLYVAVLLGGCFIATCIICVVCRLRKSCAHRRERSAADEENDQELLLSAFRVFHAQYGEPEEDAQSTHSGESTSEEASSSLSGDPAELEWTDPVGEMEVYSNAVFEEKVHIPERSGLGDGVLPDSSSMTGQNRVKQTPRMEVDSLLGNVFVNQYLIIKELGSGSFGRVKLCLNLDDNCLYALKVVSKKKLKRHLLAGRKRFFGGNLPDEDLLHEINVMKSLEHENVVRLFEVIDDPHDDKLLMVMEYVEGGPVVSEEALMSGQFRGTTEDIARNHFRDLIKGLDYLHYQNVIHRDIKPENLLLTETGTVKLSDFGSACHNPDGNDTMSDTCGTRIFFAPEMCRGTEYSGKKADIYAAGVVLYVLLFHRLPFEDQPPDKLYEKIKNEEPDYSGRPDISADAIDLLKGLLVKDPRKRLSLEQIMSHVWFTNRSNLMDIKSAKVLSVPAIDVSTKMPTSAMIPSINSVFQTIPDKQMKHFTAGSYIIKAGERLTGVYLILKGLCLVTQGNFDSVDDASDVSGDADFPDEVGAVELPSQSQFSSGPGVELFNALSQPSGELTDLATQELARFQSLSRQEVVKGVGRRTTYQHTKLKELVEQAAAVEENMQPNATKTASKKAPGKSRRGPGCIIGLDLATGSDISPKTIKVLEPIDAVFVQKESLESVFSGAEQQLQLRLLVAKLQKMELMRETVQKLSDLRPDILQMEQLRAVIRNTSQTQSTGEN